MSFGLGTSDGLGSLALDSISRCCLLTVMYNVNQNIVIAVQVCHLSGHSSDLYPVQHSAKTRIEYIQTRVIHILPGLQVRHQTEQTRPVFNNNKPKEWYDLDLAWLLHMIFIIVRPKLAKEMRLVPGLVGDSPVQFFLVWTLVCLASGFGLELINKGRNS